MDDYEDDFDYDLDDAWLYAEDEFDLADELAENQLAEPGYSGTNMEIAMESYEFELFAFWDDLEYADDAYWDYGLSGTKGSLKRKREAGVEKGMVDKSRRRRKKEEVTYSRDEDPLLFVSRKERTKAFFQPPPLLEHAVKSTFLADWRERFANVDGELDVDGDGKVESRDMPAAMKRAAEAEVDDVGGEDMEEGGEGDWEDEMDGEEEEDDGFSHEEEGGDDNPALDIDMVKDILKQRLGDAGLTGEDEAAFMQVIAKMMSGDDDADEMTDTLTNSLLGKLTSDSGGDSALSGWLSQQGVSLPDGDDDDASSVATLDLPEALRQTALNTRQNAQDSPIDSVVGEKRNSTQMPLHAGSPTSSSTKKRTASLMEENEKPSKKQKKKQVTFDVPSSSPSSDLPMQTATSEGTADLPTSEDPLMSENNLQNCSAGGRTIAKTSKTPAIPATRKRKAVEDVVEEKPPEKKKTRKRKVDMLENAAAESPMGPPARRTRAARAKSGK